MYNTEAYIERCVNSISCQDYINLEIILVNDGSTDATLSICKTLALKDKRILIYSMANSGVSVARNKGVELANGTYIQFIDADDYVMPNYVSTLHSVLIKEKAQLSVCAITLYDTSHKLLESWDAGNGILNFTKPDNNYLVELLHSFLLFGPVNKLYISKIIKGNSILFDKTISYGEDLIFNMDYMSHVEKICITNKVHYGYFQLNTNSLSNKFYENKYEISKKIHQRLITFFKNKQIENETVLEVLYQRFFDDCYNALSLISHIQFNKTLPKKLAYLKTILKDKELLKSYKFINNDKYSSKILFIIKHKMALAYYTYLLLHNKKTF